MLRFFTRGRGWELKFNPEDHSYVAQRGGDEVALISVTQVVGSLAKPGLDKWAVDTALKRVREGYRPGMAEEELKSLLEEAASTPFKRASEAASTGSSVHGWIEDYLAGKKPSFPEEPEVQKPVEAFLSWYKKAPEVWFSERAVAHVPEGFAGRVDLVLKPGIVVDFKTSKAVYPEYFLQVGGYALALEWWEGIRVRKGLIVRIGKDGFLEEVEVDLQRAKRGFLGLLEAVRVVRLGKSP